MTARGLQAVFQTFAKGPVSCIASLPLAFLEKLRPGGPWVLTAIVPDGATTTITARTPDEVEAFVRKHDGKRNLYYSVNPTRTAMCKKAAKTDIAAIEYALADLDPACRRDVGGSEGALPRAAQGVRAQADCGDR